MMSMPLWVVPLGLSGGLGVSPFPPTPKGTIAQTIQQIEGYYPGTSAYINNNPGNLVYAGQPGASKGTPILDAQGNVIGYRAAFPTYQDGIDALLTQIDNYAARGLTISQTMNIYAPASDARNNPTQYANSIAGALGVSPDTRLVDALALTSGSGAYIPDTSATVSGASTDSGSGFTLSDLFGGGGGTIDPVMSAGLMLGALGLLMLLMGRK